MHLLLIIFLLEPKTILELPGSFTTFQFYENAVYLASFNGKSIIKIDSIGNFSSFPVTNQDNNRIYEFKITPFSFYLNTSIGLVKVNNISGVTEIIYKSDITTFVITNTEEVVFADRLTNELIFLDTDNKIKFQKKNVNVNDMDYYDNKIYLLTPKGILVLDEYGNTLEFIKIPEKLNHITVDKEIYLFSVLTNVVYKKEKEWKRIELKHPIIDLKLSKEHMLTLNQYGDYLYMYDKSDF